jgi:uncharacterized membrane protein
VSAVGFAVVLAFLVWPLGRVLAGSVLGDTGWLALGETYGRVVSHRYYWSSFLNSLGLSAAVLFSVRDNLVRWAARGTDVPGFVAATASLVSATIVIAIVVASRPDAVGRVRRAARPFVLSGLVYGISYACLYSAFDRGRVTIVAPSSRAGHSGLRINQINRRTCVLRRIAQGAPSSTVRPHRLSAPG